MDFLLTAILLLFAQCYGQERCRQRTVEQVYQWSVVNYAVPPGFTPDPTYRQNDSFVIGVDIGPNNLFVTTPRVRTIAPATLSTIPLPWGNPNSSPILQPYPNLAWNTLNGNNTDCNSTLVSVERTTRDGCNRLWAIDAGVIYSFMKPQVICPPKIVIFNLTTNQMVRIVQIPSSVLTPISFLLNIRVDNVTNTRSSGNACDNVYAYIADNASPAVIVYKSPENTFSRISHPSMYPDPDSYNLQVDGETFHYFRGITGMDVGGKGTERRLYYQSPAAEKTYYIPTSALHQPPPLDASELPVRLALIKTSEATGLLVDDSDGCVVFDPQAQASIVTWNPQTRLTRLVTTNSTLIKIMPNFNQANRTTVYATSTRGQRYVNGNVNTSEINVRILKITSVP